MEAVEFFQCYYKMCNSHVSGCVGCEAQGIDCELTTGEPEKLVAAVERWAKAHQEEAADVTKPKQDEQSCGNNTLEERIDRLEKCCDEMNERLICFIHDTVDEVQSIKKHAEHQDEFMQTQCVHVDSEEVESMNEPKRTNKDVLLASFPDALMDNNGIPYACPNRLDAHYNCDKFENCLRCRHTHWLAEVEE